MSKFKDLFSEPQQAHARRSDPETSHEAAAKITKKLTELQEQVLLLFRVHGQLTDLDLDRMAGTGRSTFRTRRSELTKLGYVVFVKKVHQEGGTHSLWELSPWAKR